MYASINSVYQMVMRQAAKEENGFISPTDFNYYASEVQQALAQSILSEYRMFQMNAERYLNYMKGSYNSMEAINDDLITLRRNRISLSSSGGNNVFQRPDNYAYIISLSVLDTPVTLVDISRREYYVNAFDQAPTATKPIAFIDYNSIEVLPVSVTSNVLLSYYKLPQGATTSGVPSSSQPNWAYSVVGSKSIYDATNSIDFELPKHLEYRLASMILAKVGIELRESDLYQMANNETQTKAQEAKL